MKNKLVKIAIIGNGPVGVSYLEEAHKIAEEYPNVQFEIDWYGKTEPFGPGIYNPKWFTGEAKCQILNVLPGDMKGKFEEFCETKGITKSEFAQRGLYGDYLVRRAQELTENRPANLVSVNKIIADVQEHLAQKNLSSYAFEQNGEHFCSDSYPISFLALGHNWNAHRPVQLSDCDAFSEHPYAPEKLGKYIDARRIELDEFNLGFLGQGAGTIDGLRWSETYHSDGKTNYWVISKNANPDFWWAYDWDKVPRIPTWLKNCDNLLSELNQGGYDRIISCFKASENSGHPVSHMLVALNDRLEQLGKDTHTDLTDIQTDVDKVRNWAERRYGALTAPENIKLIKSLYDEGRLHFVDTNSRIDINAVTFDKKTKKLNVFAGKIMHLDGLMLTAPNARCIETQGLIQNPLLRSIHAPATSTGLVKLDKNGQIENKKGLFMAGPMTAARWGIESFIRQIEASRPNVKKIVHECVQSGPTWQHNA